jgi:hypothetical protein
MTRATQMKTNLDDLPPDIRKECAELLRLQALLSDDNSERNAARKLARQLERQDASK